MATSAVGEYEPAQISENTDVKVLVSIRNVNQTAWASLYQDSDTHLLQMSTFSSDDFISGKNEDVYLRTCNELIASYQDLPTDMFITNLIQQYASSEPDLDATRVLLFESLKTHDDFPFDLECDIKRRVFIVGVSIWPWN